MKRNNFSKMVLTLFASLALVITGTSTVNNKTQEVVKAEEITDSIITFAKSLSDGLETNGTYSNTYYKMSAGNYAKISSKNLFNGDYLDSDFTLNVACGTFGTWSNPKTVTINAAFYNSDDTIIGEQVNFTTSTLDNKEGTYRGPLVISKPSDTSKIDYLKIVFSDFNSGPTLRFKSIKFSCATVNVPEGYQINFDTDGGTQIDSQLVAENGKVSVPSSNPTKAGYEFDGWYTSKNYETKFDFENTLINSNITIYAKWNKISNPTQDAINEINSYMSLKYTYEFENSFEIPNYELVKDATTLVAGDQIIITAAEKKYANGNLTSGSFDSIDLTKNTISDACVLTLGGDSSAWTLSNEEGNLIGATAAKKLALDDGEKTWTITIDDNGNATIASTKSAYGRILYNVNSPRFLNYTSNTSTSMLLPQIYKKVAGEKYSNVDFRIKCAVDSSISTIENVTEYGIQVSTSAGAKTYALSSDSTNKYTDATANVTYIVIQLGDVINEVEKAGVDFTVKAYAVSDGVTYYSTSSKTYSVANMIKTYYEDEATKEQVGPVYDLFVKANLIA